MFTFAKRAAGGGKAAKRAELNGLLRASGKGNRVCETERALRDQTPAYDSMHERAQSAKPGGTAGYLNPVPATVGAGFLFFKRRIKQ